MKRQRLWARVQNGSGRSARRAGARLKQKFEIWLAQHPEITTNETPPAVTDMPGVRMPGPWRPPVDVPRNWRDLLGRVAAAPRDAGFIPFSSNKEE